MPLSAEHAPSNARRIVTVVAIATLAPPALYVGGSLLLGGPLGLVVALYALAWLLPLAYASSSVAIVLFLLLRLIGRLSLVTVLPISVILGVAQVAVAGRMQIEPIAWQAALGWGSIAGVIFGTAFWGIWTNTSSNSSSGRNDRGAPSR